MIQNSFLALIEQSIRLNWENPAFTELQGKTFLYKDFARELDKMHDFFKAGGVKRGDKIALCGKNSANWAITFFATLTYGAVSVSILNEFDKDSIEFIVDHSDSKILFTDKNIWNKLDVKTLPKLETAVALDDFTIIKSNSEELKQFATNAPEYFTKKYDKGFFVNDVAFRKDKPEELAVINYTSGTTSSPKGVMVPYRSLWSNTKYANDNLKFLEAGDNVLCMLPMAHSYGLAFEILNSISLGCNINFLGNSPTPTVLKDALKITRPKLVLAVPLILEKIVKNVVFPKLKEGSAATLVKIPLLNNIIYSKVRKSMLDFFGGNLVQVVIGGAALSSEVENFLKKVKFPFTVGYGMTECGPLISYVYWSDYRKRSSGQVVDRMQAKIDSEDPHNTVGEILVKGTNLMLGYYKNNEATNEAFTEDGWLKTGDLGTIDKDNFIYIKGRNKNMLLGPSGQNIYPEEIEEKINNSPYVHEVLVIGENKRIVALIVPEKETLEKEDIAEDKWEELFRKEIDLINSTLPAYSRIATFRIRDTGFEKTPKRSIRRFKYQE